MDIAIIGAGPVGAALGGSFAKAGRTVAYGVRNPGDPKYASLIGGRASVLGIHEAAASAGVVFLAVPWQSVPEALAACGGLGGKILVDCTNPIKADFSGLQIGQTTSGGEVVASLAKGALVVKCFNQTGFANMADSAYEGHKPIMFAAGDDENAVRIVAGLAREIGFDAVPMAGLDRSRQLEQLAWLWIDLAVNQGLGRDIAFALMRR